MFLPQAETRMEEYCGLRGLVICGKYGREVVPFVQWIRMIHFHAALKYR